jgi:hypothetical protein
MKFFLVLAYLVYLTAAKAFVHGEEPSVCYVIVLFVADRGKGASILGNAANPGFLLGGTLGREVPKLAYAAGADDLNTLQVVSAYNGVEYFERGAHLVFQHNHVTALKQGPVSA